MKGAVEQRSQMLSRVLGDELRILRRRRGWTRRDLLKRLELDISLQTIATYEQGTRQCSVIRLWELTEALDVPLDQLVARVLERVGEREYSGLFVDLRAAERTTEDQLGPLRGWAKVQMSTRPDNGAPVVRLDGAALDSLAELCGLNTADLVRLSRRAGLIRKNDAK